MINIAIIIKIFNIQSYTNWIETANPLKSACLGGLSGEVPGGFSGKVPDGLTGKVPDDLTGKVPGGFSGMRD